MVYLTVRHAVADYAKWRPYFDQDDNRRRAAGATGVGQVYRDAADPNTITIIMEWDTAAKALKFAQDPALREVEQKAGVMGAPSLVTILSRT